MRVLHTSDWHLGRSFHGAGLLAEQAAWVDHLVEVVQSESVDLVIVAGDVYDRALPGIEAVRLLDEALERVSAAGSGIVMISGNHDSSARLSFGSKLFARAGVHVATDVRRCAEPILLGRDGVELAVYAIPYLEPELTREWFGAERSHEAVLTAAAQRCRDDLATRPGLPSIAVAHAFVRGGLASSSERDISVGGVADVPASALAGFDYVALGHLHGRQAIDEKVRYSGSPVPYSFSEARHTKGSWLLEVSSTTVDVVGFVEAPSGRGLATVRGSLDELLTSGQWSDVESCWVSAVVTDAVRPTDCMARLQRRFPHAIVLAFEPEGAVGDDGRSYTQRLAGRSPADVVGSFVEHVRGVAPSEAEAVLVAEVVDEARRIVSDADPDAVVVSFPAEGEASCARTA